MNFETWNHTPTRLRFFLATCWVSLTAGILLYILTFVFQYPFWFVLGILLLRAVVQSFRDMDQFTIKFADGQISGVSLFGGRLSFPVTKINWSKTYVRNGRFFIESVGGETISARLFWYTAEAQSNINRLVHGVRTPTNHGLDAEASKASFENG